MKICKMTATFGKLRHQELILQDGLNIITAPNEWGKSTWCAFLTAMLYGIDTSARRSMGKIPDKERFAPWSGEPMSGSMELNWNGRDITIERSGTVKVPFGHFRAFETHTGAEVPELTGENCGLMLLGVEKSVFLRSGFLKLSDLPVTQDEALRRRLNGLVTTGDESGAADSLADSLKNLKNACKHNKTGKLPDAEREREKIAATLEDLRFQKDQSQLITRQQAALAQEIDALCNHQQALDYADAADAIDQYQAALAGQEKAAAEVSRWETLCQAQPDEETVTQQLTRLRDLREQREVLRTEAQFQPPCPQIPEAPAVFRGTDPAQAVSQAREDAQHYHSAQTTAGDRRMPVLGILAAILGVVGLALPYLAAKIAGGTVLSCGIVLLLLHLARSGKAKTDMAVLTEKYRPLSAAQWEAAALSYQTSRKEYEDALESYKATVADLNRRLQLSGQALDALTGRQSVTAFEESLLTAQANYRQLDAARTVFRQACATAEALASQRQVITPPSSPDTLTLSREETERALREAKLREAQLHKDLGGCLGRISLLGQEDDLQAQLNVLDKRIAQLNEIYGALEIALYTAEKAKRELQKRFAPRITQNARQIFSDLTGGRYDRLNLEADLSLTVAAEQEDTLTSSTFRSDGTIDQLYFALRLAVSQELTPEAPLILDDALVRFDDVRLKAALKVLRQTAEQKQIILFTCQSRESK